MHIATTAKAKEPNLKSLSVVNGHYRQPMPTGLPHISLLTRQERLLSIYSPPYSMRLLKVHYPALENIGSLRRTMSDGNRTCRLSMHPSS